MEKQLTIWLVEDDRAQSELVGLLLKSINPSVVCKSVIGAEELLAAFALEERLPPLDDIQNIEIIITDLRMPKLNGIELITRIRTLSHFQNVPVLVMSASDLPSDINAAYSAGANAYLVKPSGLEEFEVLLRHVVSFWLNVKT